MENLRANDTTSIDLSLCSRRKFLVTFSELAALLTLKPSASSAAIRNVTALDPSQAAGAALSRNNVYAIRRLSEYELQDLYQRMLEDACAYARGDWKTAAFDEKSGYWGNGISGGNGGIRTIVSMALACATLLKYGEQLDAAQRNELLTISRAALGFVVATHRTGWATCTDAKQWGATDGFGSGSWQSGMWTGTLSWSAWLIWQQLDPDLQSHIQRVVTWECDILARRPPPNGLWLDTKAEENGWEVPCLVLGSLMFRSSPNAAKWHETALNYMMNTLCTEADTHDTTMVDGRPIDQWVRGANLQPDFTLENHNRFHPSYVGCASYFLTQANMYYTYGGHAAPQAATHHLLDTWRMFKTIILPWGEAAYPQGMDWELHGLPFINLYASLATHWHDSYAAHMEENSIQYLRYWQLTGHGSLSVPGSRFGITRHAINAEQIAYGFLAHKIFGPAAHGMTSCEATKREEGVRDYPYVDFVTHRTREKFVSFSWKNEIMGMLIPLGPGNEGNPDFTVPLRNGFVGSFEVGPLPDGKANREITVLDHTYRQTSDGFETKGTLLICGDRLKQTIKLTSLGDRTVVYEDYVTALENAAVKAERGIPIGIENDQITGGLRIVTSQNRRVMVNWQQTQPPISISGNWANIDGRLGMVIALGAGISYVKAEDYTPGIAVFSDVLYGSYSDRTRQFIPGQEVAHRLAILSVEVTPEETSKLARSCRIERSTSSHVLRFSQPDGTEIRVQMLPPSRVI